MVSLVCDCAVKVLFRLVCVPGTDEAEERRLKKLALKAQFDKAFSEENGGDDEEGGNKGRGGAEEEGDDYFTMASRAGREIW